MTASIILFVRFFRIICRTISFRQIFLTKFPFLRRDLKIENFFYFLGINGNKRQKMRWHGKETRQNQFWKWKSTEKCPKNQKITVFVIDKNKTSKNGTTHSEQERKSRKKNFCRKIQREIKQKTKSVILIIRINNFPNVFHVLIKLKL